MFGIVYAPAWWKLCFVRPYGEKRAYAPESCSVSILRPRIQPSLVTASAISMCHGARVDEQGAHRLGRGVHLAAEAAADGAAYDLDPVQRELQVSADDPEGEVERLRA